jgi:hypothetical protein
MACLAYLPSKVEYMGELFERKDLFSKILEMIRKLDKVYNFIPWEGSRSDSSATHQNLIALNDSIETIDHLNLTDTLTASSPEKHTRRVRNLNTVDLSKVPMVQEYSKHSNLHPYIPLNIRSNPRTSHFSANRTRNTNSSISIKRINLNSTQERLTKNSLLKRRKTVSRNPVSLQLFIHSKDSPE